MKAAATSFIDSQCFVALTIAGRNFHQLLNRALAEVVKFKLAFGMLTGFGIGLLADGDGSQSFQGIEGFAQIFLSFNFGPFFKLMLSSK